MNLKHTPGPWQVMGADPTRVSATINGYPTTVAVVNRARDVALIAAAPDALALAELIEGLVSSPSTRDYVAPSVQAAARAFLAKVRS